MQNGTLKHNIISVEELLANKSLKIPIYQRPYKWQAKNVIQLLNDIKQFKNKSAYRLGTIVIHTENSDLNIVLKKIISKLDQSIFSPTFKNEISIQNIKTNYAVIERMLAKFDEEEIYFLFTKCQLIEFRLSNISEAFQFFDSQNARGKDLEPHDLLKAFHLREFSEEEKKEQEKIVDNWEAIDSNEIADLFSETLYRIREWSNGNSARYFTKNEIAVFKGINLNKLENYPFTEIIRIAHFYVDRYNSSFERNIDFHKTNFPFQLDQTLINGKRFFEMVNHYHSVFKQFAENVKNEKNLNAKAKKIIDVLDAYPSRKRIGDVYVRNLFNCAIIYYIDKFGFVQISEVIEKIFIWAYRLRIRHQAVYLATVDNYVVQENNIFKLIKDAIYPVQVLTFSLDNFDANDKKVTKADELIQLFKDLNYYDE